MVTLANTWKDAFSAGPVQIARSHVRDSADADSSSNSKNVIVAGDFYIDLDSCSATVRGQVLNLTCAEFDVLVFIVSHRKRVVSSNTTLATKPDECGVRQSQFLPALLSLRKKLQESVPGNHYIQTEAWVIYDFHPGT